MAVSSETGSRFLTCRRLLPLQVSDVVINDLIFITLLPPLPLLAETDSLKNCLQPAVQSRKLAKAKKPLSDGEMVKSCAVQMAKAFGDDNMAKNVR
ncbi:hypothetical protein F7725_007656 [Dissostichus mawsoni]|uniref:Uncharacterized protein n=1 Tax=Dissostichus mawsoni TaxID=36200 RepID=A0A7J5Y5X5_DISMA|nr:hypothetical protein F7725_007656 [Dissostichus mawsoni]